MVTGDYPIQIKRYQSARRLRLRVLNDGTVVVTCHPLTRERDIDRFITEHQVWIAEQRQKALARLSHLTLSRDQLMFRGDNLAFRLNVSRQRRPTAVLSNKTILVTAPSEDDQTVRAILEKWYRAEAQKRFCDRVPLLADLVGKSVANITIRSQKTRWGSCSSRTTISLNWRLIMAPDLVSDYVIYHELAHLTQMNHSARFWRLVEDYYPNYQEAERWLDEHHQLLQF